MLKALFNAKFGSTETQSQPIKHPDHVNAFIARCGLLECSPGIRPEPGDRPDIVRPGDARTFFRPDRRFTRVRMV